jgi:ribosome-binding factor A
MSHRIERFSSTLKQSLADIMINDINNPHLKSVSIKDVIISPDFKKARIYVTPAISGERGDCYGADDLIRQLIHAKGFIKRILAKRMHLKYIPELSFISSDDKISNSIE